MIASIKEIKHIEKALDSGLRTIFLLSGHIGEIQKYVDLFKSQNRHVFLHIEKIGGLSCDREGLEFVARYIKPTGIITTKNNLVKYANKLKLFTIQRLFIIDSEAIRQGLLTINETSPSAVEVMPARIPSKISEIKKQIQVPIITGGLLENREQILEALEHGAMAVSSGNPKLWKEKF